MASGETRLTFPKARTLVPGTRRTALTWRLTAGLGMSWGERATLDLAWRYTDAGVIETGAGPGRVEWLDGSRDPGGGSIWRRPRPRCGATGCTCLCGMSSDPPLARPRLGAASPVGLTERAAESLRKIRARREGPRPLNRSAPDRDAARKCRKRAFTTHTDRVGRAWPALLGTLRRSHTMGMQSKVHPTHKTDRLMAMACLELQRHGRVPMVVLPIIHTLYSRWCCVFARRRVRARRGQLPGRDDRPGRSPTLRAAFSPASPWRRGTRRAPRR